MREHATRWPRPPTIRGLTPRAASEPQTKGAGHERAYHLAVLLTTATTVLGLSPLLYERNDALLFLVPFVASMLGGLVLAGLFVLFLLPAMVMIADGRRE